MRTVSKLFTLVAMFTFTAVYSQAAVIVVGDRNLLPNTPGQTVQISVSGGDLVQGLNFYAQIADGGPAAGGVVNAPTITAVDILTGTIFSPNNTGQQDPGSVAQVAARTTTTSSGAVIANGLLATVKVDTTGFSAGTWTLSLADTLNGSTDFAGTSIDITNGTLTIQDVPEPGAITILCGLLIFTRRLRG